jgi:hypothetical protein
LIKNIDINIKNARRIDAVLQIAKQTQFLDNILLSYPLLFFSRALRHEFYPSKA